MKSPSNQELINARVYSLFHPNDLLMAECFVVALPYDAWMAKPLHSASVNNRPDYVPERKWYMRIYHRGDNSPGNWLIAGSFLIAAMMFAPMAGNAVSLPYNLAGTTVDGNGLDVGGIKDIGSITGHGGKGGKGKLHPTKDPKVWRGGRSDPDTLPVTAVPEPGTVVLLISGLGMMLWNCSHKPQ